MDIFKKLFEIVKKHKKDIYYIYYLAILAGVVQLIIPMTLQGIINFISANAMSVSLIVLIMFSIVCVLAYGFIQINQMKMTEKIQQYLAYDYTLLYANNILKYQEKDKIHLGEKANTYFDLQNLQKGINKIILDFPSAFIQIIFGMVLLSFYHPVFILFGVILIALIVVILYLTGGTGLKTSLEESHYKYKIAHWLTEIARTRNSISTGLKESFAINHSDQLLSGYLNARTAHFKVLKFQYLVLVFFKVVITGALLIVGVYLLLEQSINLGQFVAAELIIVNVLASVEKIIYNLDVVYDVMTSIKKLHTMGDQMKKYPELLKPELHSNAQYNIKTNNNHSLTLKLDNHYQLISNSFPIRLILKSIAGIQQDNICKTYIDNIPIEQYDIEDYKSKILYIQGKKSLFQGNIMQNILLSDTIEDQIKFNECLNISGLDISLQEFHEGVMTKVFPAGDNFSDIISFQILAARILYHKKAVTIFDMSNIAYFDEKIFEIIHQQLNDSTFILYTGQSKTINNFQLISL